MSPAGVKRPVVREGKIVPRMLLPISLTFDHRVADGADGARFAAAIVRRLERPEQLLAGMVMSNAVRAAGRRPTHEHRRRP